MKIYDTIIIGSGPSGYTAAIYASRGNLDTLLFKGTQPGGQLTTTTVIENFPGYENGIDGNELMMEMEKQAKRFGTEMLNETITKVDFSGQPLTVYAGETPYHARTIIIATGARSRKTDAPGEERLWAKGVSTCATCDGFFYKDKDVMVLGGGDTAMEEAQFLTKFCKSVTIVHRRDKFRASKIMADRVLRNEKIKVIWNASVKEFIGEDKLSAVQLEDTQSGEITEHAIEGVFLAIGHIPNTEAFEGHIELESNGYIKAYPHMQTNREGVFFAGDCEDQRYRQAITAAGDGCQAAMEVMRYLENHE